MSLSLDPFNDLCAIGIKSAAWGVIMCNLDYVKLDGTVTFLCWWTRTASLDVRLGSISEFSTLPSSMGGSACCRY